MLSWKSARTRLALGSSFAVVVYLANYLSISSFGLQATGIQRSAVDSLVRSVLEHELFFLRGLRSVGSILDTNISVRHLKRFMQYAFGPTGDNLAKKYTQLVIRTRQCGPHRSWPCWASRTRRTTSATAPWPNGPASIRCADPANATTVERCPQLVAASCAQAEGNGNLYGAKYHAGSVFLAGYQCAVHRLKYRTLPSTAPCPTRPLALS